MPTTIIKPNSTIDNSQTVSAANAASIHEALASKEEDESLSGSYIETSDWNAFAQVGFENANIASTDKVGWVRLDVSNRANPATSIDPPEIQFSIYSPSSINSWLVPVGTDYFDVSITDLRKRYLNDNFIQPSDVDNFKLEVFWDVDTETIDVGHVVIAVKHNSPPIATINSPTGIVTDTSKPNIDWTFDANDSDNDGQAEFELRIYDEADVPATPPTNPDDITAEPVYSVTENAFFSDHDVTEDLPNDTTYRIYLRVRKDWSGDQELWSDWTNDTFSTNYNEPAAPNLTVNLASNPYEHTEISLSEGAGGDVSTDYFRLWYRDSAEDDWTEIANEIQAGTYLDPTIIPDIEREYRARAYSEASGLPVASSSEFGTLTISTHENWTLIDPDDVNNYLDLDVEMDELPMPYAQDASVFNPFGNEDDDLTPPVVVLGDIRTPEITMNAGTVGQPDYKALVALHRAQKTLMLRTPIPEDARFVRFGNTFTPVLKNSNDLYRVTEFNLHQTARPEDLEVTQ